MSSGEKEDGLQSVVQIFSARNEIMVTKPNSNEEPKQFTFDGVFDQNISQEDIYERTAAPIVENVLEGYNGTVFAYGQTGTGKTHTMTGIQGVHEQRGVIPRSFENVFQSI